MFLGGNVNISASCALSVKLGLETHRAIYRNSLEVADKTSLGYIDEGKWECQNIWTEGTKRLNTSSAICHRKATKISVKEQTISVQVIVKQNIFFPFKTCLKELNFSEKNTIQFYTSFFKILTFWKLYLSPAGKFNHKEWEIFILYFKIYKIISGALVYSIFFFTLFPNWDLVASESSAQL